MHNHLAQECSLKFGCVLDYVVFVFHFGITEDTIPL